MSSGHLQSGESFPEESLPEQTLARHAFSDSTFGEFEAEDSRRAPHRYWLHTLLLCLTLLSTTVVGAALAEGFAKDRSFSFDTALGGYLQAWHQPTYLLTGLPFSLTLLTILLAHEMGHYLTARYYDVDVSLPYFLPAPTLIGTFGAFIQIRSGIYSRRTLFDIGAGGPLAGFVILLGPLAAGVALSKVVPGIGTAGEFAFGTPGILRILEMAIFPGTPANDILLHPMARAAWAGLLATALNLLPVGQLDGGHILYAFAGERTKVLSRVFVAALASLGTYQLVTTHYLDGYSWLIWSAALFLFAMRHPIVDDPYPLGPTRGWLGLAALMVFVLSFTVYPVRNNVPQHVNNGAHYNGL